MNVLELIEQTKESYQLGLINLEDIHNIDVTSFNKDNIFPDRIKVCDKDKTILEVEQYKIGYCQINKPIDKDSTDHLHIYTKDGSVNLARIKIIKDNLKRKLVFNKYLGIKLDTYIDYGFDVQELEEIFIPLNEEPYVFKHKGSYLTVKKLKASHFKRIK